ncbi:DUF6069 family protein [Rhodococcoides kyotonense]|uniref:Uncharacterized protein n=1 Tax=Rhodococcoides kyotonense TaxID=398843 RepID=A0A239LXT2_9NOCA|nr:DUF6069 family protein [Rhodococcus kyotonensis]SNT35326.1 hypothetical protein SAMN05421642_1155 [Rhodococcus kyotonensis]
MIGSISSTRSLPRWQAVLLSVIVALVLNLVLWLVGLAAGGSFELTDGGQSMSVAPGGVVILTLVPMVVGMGVAALISLRWLGVVRVAQVVGVIAPLGTIAMTVSADFDTVSTVTLALMHVVIAAVVFVGLEALLRGARAKSMR